MSVAAGSGATWVGSAVQAVRAIKVMMSVKILFILSSFLLFPIRCHPSVCCMCCQGYTFALSLAALRHFQAYQTTNRVQATSIAANIR